MTRPVLMFHSGAGGVGKTTAVKKVVELATDFSLTVAVMPSITRSVYARLGIVGEKEATEMTVLEQILLQTEIQKTYYDSSLQFLLENADKDVVMIDRSPLDHISYLLHNLAFHLSLSEVLDYTGHAWDWLHSLRQYSSVVAIQYYNFPEPWHLAADPRDSSDGFRFDAGGKNYMWNCLLETFLAKTYDEMAERLRAAYADRPTARTSEGKFEICYFTNAGMTIEERAQEILKKVRLMKAEAHE